MFRRYRQRRGPYAIATPSPISRVLWSAFIVILAFVVLLFAGRAALHLLGVGNRVERRAAILTLTERGGVTVTIDGGDVQEAEDGLRLYSGDRVSTGHGQAMLLLFDGTIIRLDTHTDLAIIQSAQGTRVSQAEFALDRGTVWIETPSLLLYSGSILRSVATSAYTLSLPSRTQAVIGERGFSVFTADDLGVHVNLRDDDRPLLIGEGQRFAIPPEPDFTRSPYAYRTPLDPLALQNSFLEESRQVARSIEHVPTAEVQPVPQSGRLQVPLIVLQPQDGFFATGTTVHVRGTIGSEVARVRVNGYAATVDDTLGTFVQELALTERDVNDILIEAVDGKGITIAQERRSVRRDLAPPPSPTITIPAPQGSVYRTPQAEIVLRGAAPPDAVGIVVNDYRLQLYEPGNATWSYLANTRLGNLVPGRNVYIVTAVDHGGNRSDPVSITVLFEEGEEGIVTSGSGASTVTTTEDIPTNDASFPRNSPIMPGMLRITGPTAGTMHSATGSEFLIVGTTPAETTSVWVNGYRLRLYLPGKTTWNYIASTMLGTLNTGRNVYRIVARNAKGEILDATEYVVEY